MADKKITELTELEAPQSTDVLPIVDLSGTPITKKVEVSNLVTKTLAGLGNVDNVQQMPLSYLDTDGALAANSDTKVPSQKAVKTYADTKVSQGAWTDYSGIATITGWTSYTTKKIAYQVLGSFLYLVYDIQGTSNATAAYFNLPFTVRQTDVVYFPGCAQVIDNGVNQVNAGLVNIEDSGNRFKVYKDMAGAAFTNSGTKRISGWALLPIAP